MQYAAANNGTHALALGSGVDKLLTEVIPVLVGRGLVDNNLLVVVAQLVNDVLVLLGKLQVIVGSDAVLRDGGSANSILLVRILVRDHRRWLRAPRLPARFGARCGARCGAAEARDGGTIGTKGGTHPD